VRLTGFGFRMFWMLVEILEAGARRSIFFLTMGLIRPVWVNPKALL